MRLWSSTNRRPGPRPHRLPNRVRGDSMVPRARDHAQLEGLQQVHRRVERRLHPSRDAQQQATVPGQALSRSAQPHTQHHRVAEQRGLAMHTERARAWLFDKLAQEAQGAIREDLSKCRPKWYDLILFSPSLILTLS